MRKIEIVSGALIGLLALFIAIILALVAIAAPGVDVASTGFLAVVVSLHGLAFTWGACQEWQDSP